MKVVIDGFGVFEKNETTGELFMNEFFITLEDMFDTNAPYDGELVKRVSITVLEDIDVDKARKKFLERE